MWDILFRTHNHPDYSDIGDLGLEGNPVPRGFIRQVFSRFARSSGRSHISYAGFGDELSALRYHNRKEL